MRRPSWLRWPWVSAEWADTLQARADRLRDERDEALSQRETAVINRRQITRQYVEADGKYIDVCLDKERLTADLTAARKRLAEYGARLTVAEVLEEHDVHRKALADALGEQKRHLGWDHLIGEVGGLAGVVAGLQQRLDVADSRPTDSHWRAEARRERDRAEALQKRLDDAVGLAPGGILNSAPWQPGYQDPTPDKAVSP